MDKKEKVILEHYKNIIETRNFDEYDILGFLIFTREKVKTSNYSLITEFTDLIAHRHRNRGVVMNNIAIAITNGYACCNGKIQGYNGIEWDEWKREWENFGRDININIDENIITEITVCIYSLAQDTTYENDQGINGKIVLFLNEGSLCMMTTEGNLDSSYICFSKFGNFNIELNIEAGHIKEPVETERKDGNLYLKCSQGTIFKI